MSKATSFRALGPFPHPSAPTEYRSRVWTCMAWCELRSDLRVFRVDRIEACADTGDAFAIEPGRSYADYLASLSPDGAQAE